MASVGTVSSPLCEGVEHKENRHVSLQGRSSSYSSSESVLILIYGCPGKVDVNPGAGWF